MEPLNYLRQVRADLGEKLIPSLWRHFPMTARDVERLLSIAAQAAKFVLPVGGRVLDDRLRGLSGDEPLRLPYPSVVLEYPAKLDGIGVVEKSGKGCLTASRRVVLAMQDGEEVAVYLLFFSDELGYWTMAPFGARVGRAPAGAQFALGLSANDFTDFAMTIFPVGSIDEVSRQAGVDWREKAFLDLTDECRAVLEFVEALACSNVGHESLGAPRKLNRAAARRGALPFDEYRVLYVRKAGGGEQERVGDGGDRRSPREHLRRGHVRRLPDGRRLWINACVVNAGAGGAVSKTYDLTRLS